MRQPDWPGTASSGPVLFTLIHINNTYNKQKEIKINQSLDMKNIEKRAIEELGMQKPDNSQIVYVDVRKENFVKVAGENKVAAASSSQGIKGFFKSIWEYFN